MPRRKVVAKRHIIPDPIFEDDLVTKFINCIMRDGKKSTAEKIFYGAMEIIESKIEEEPLKMFKKAIENTKPYLEVRSRRVGGATYQVPVEVRYERGLSLSMRWLLNSAKARREYTMKERLAGELLDAANNTGTTIKKREDTHKMAEANKAFSHYRW